MNVLFDFKMHVTVEEIYQTAVELLFSTSACTVETRYELRACVWFLCPSVRRRFQFCKSMPPSSEKTQKCI